MDVHYYSLEYQDASEKPIHRSRANPRGNIPAVNVSIDDVYNITNNVTITSMHDFESNIDLEYYRKYFPKTEGWSYPSSMDNMIKQWYSIQTAWNYMESFSLNYNRVGVFRIDLIYETPIYLDEKEAVQPNFGYAFLSDLRYMNDRFFYGSYNASKHWASHRFKYVPKYLSLIQHTKFESRGLHSETFLYYLMRDYYIDTGKIFGPYSDIILNSPFRETVLYYLMKGFRLEPGAMCGSRVRNDCLVRYDCKEFFEMYQLKNFTLDDNTIEVVVKKDDS